MATNGNGSNGGSDNGGISDVGKALSSGQPGYLSGNINAAYRLPDDPLKTKIEPTLIYRDLPSTITTEWDPELMRQALRTHLIGQFQGSARLTEATLADGRIQATLGTRTSALLSQPIRFLPADVPGQVREARRACDAWAECFPFTFGEEVLSMVLRWGIMMGFAICENLWDTSESLWRPKLKVWHPEFVWYNLITRFYIASTWDGLAEVTGGDGKWVLYSPFGEYRGWVNGAVRAVASPWLARQYAAYRDWPRYSEVHGIPILKAIVPFDGDDEQKRQFHTNTANLGVESVIMVPQDESSGRKYDVELVEAASDTWQAFQGLVEACDMSIVLALLGQNLTTEVKEGSFAAARVHGDVRQDLLERDARTLEHMIYSQIARPFALYNFGDADLAPRTSWQVEPIEDKGARAKAFVDLAAALKTFSECSVPVDIKRAMRQFNVPLDENIIPTEPDVPITDAHLAAGVVTINEVRARLGLPPMSGGDRPVGSEATPEPQPVAEPVEAKPALTLAPADVAKVVKVDEGRSSLGLPPLGDERGEMMIPELEAEMAPPAPAPFGQPQSAQSDEEPVAEPTHSVSEPPSEPPSE